MLTKLLKNNKGVTLLELMVAVSMFSIVILLTTGIFQSVVEGQRSAIAVQSTQESMRFALEVMSKEIRMARGEHEGSDCVPSPPGLYKVFNTNGSGGGPDLGSVLYFKNKDGECVTYELSGHGLQVIRDGQGTFFITPDEIKVSNLLFYVVDDQGEAFHSLQPRVTIKMEAEMVGGKERYKQKIQMQTTVSSRYYE